MRLIPIYTEERKEFFVDASIIEPHLRLVSNGRDELQVRTAYLAFDTEIDLLGISSTPELIASGLVNATDVIGTRNRISEVHFLIDGRVIGVQSAVVPGSTFNFDLSKGTFVSSVKFDGFVTDTEEALAFEIYAELNVATSVINATAKVTKGNAVPLGYLVNVARLDVITRKDERRQYSNQWTASDRIPSWDTVAAMHRVAGYFKELRQQDGEVPLTPSQIIELIDLMIQVEKNQIASNNRPDDIMDRVTGLAKEPRMP